MIRRLEAYGSDLVCCIGSLCIGRVGQASLWVGFTIDVANNFTFHFREKECFTRLSSDAPAGKGSFGAKLSSPNFGACGI